MYNGECGSDDTCDDSYDDIGDIKDGDTCDDMQDYYEDFCPDLCDNLDNIRDSLNAYFGITIVSLILMSYIAVMCLIRLRF